MFAAAISDDESALVFGQYRREFGFGCVVVDRSWDAAFFERFVTIDIENRD